MKQKLKIDEFETMTNSPIFNPKIQKFFFLFLFIPIEIRFKWSVGMDGTQISWLPWFLFSQKEHLHKHMQYSVCRTNIYQSLKSACCLDISEVTTTPTLFGPLLTQSFSSSHVEQFHASSQKFSAVHDPCLLVICHNEIKYFLKSHSCFHCDIIKGLTK